MAAPDPIISSDVVAWQTARPLLLKWLERCRINQLQHYAAANYYDRANRLLGLPTVVLSTVVGTTVFASLQKQVGLAIVLTVGAISILAAVLAALQTFLRYAERAEKHRSAAATYGGLRKQIEAVGFLPIESRGTVKEFIGGLRAQLDSLAQNSPTPPKSVWQAFSRQKGAGYLRSSGGTFLEETEAAHPETAPAEEPYRW